MANKAANIFHKENGQYWREYIYVNLIITLGNNNLNARACNELCNAQWAKLKLINLSKHYSLYIAANKIT